jgi:hypothetical protein
MNVRTADEPVAYCEMAKSCTASLFKSPTAREKPAPAYVTAEFNVPSPLPVKTRNPLPETAIS